MNGKRYVVLGLAAVLGVTATACSGSSEETEEIEKAVVDVVNPERGSLSTDTAYIGMAAPQQQVYVTPMVSGTVTEVNFQVGDTVQEGDLLFRIDDEAARLQLASAEAAYHSAEAGVQAATGGARDLQNYQTEQSIQQLRDSLYDVDDGIDEMEDNLGDLRDAGKQLSSARSAAKAEADQAATAYYASQIELQPQIDAAKETVEDLQTQIAAAESGTGTGIVTDLQAKLETATKELSDLQNQLTGVKAKYDEAQAFVSQLDGQIAANESAKTQLKSGIDTAEDSRETINENLATAEQAYAITQNEVYPDTDATYAAQLESASVGIDSAQMQLDYYTVEAPIGGVVESVGVEENQMVSAGTAAYIISNKDSMTVTFQVTEEAKNALAVGDPVTVERTGNTYKGTITEVGTMAGAQTHLFTVKASVAGASDSIPNGVTVKVYATTRQEDDKLIVPYDALYFSAGDAYVYCVEEGTIVRTPVTVGLMSDTEAVIEEGLSEDSLVVDNWSSRLRDGAPAQIASINGEVAAVEADSEDVTIDTQTEEVSPTEEVSEEEPEEAPELEETSEEEAPEEEAE